MFTKAIYPCSEAKRLRLEAEAAAKAKVERMILGEEEIGEN